ncbi:short-chain dehydrogenase/reductase SDR [Catenulispora acidiphila DSM 44928]|uniref:Short-chain dehydrogenase/reductase SDR n=1 Tax=Catenulispora acidiphila (strain DSM 44928 / JCM 14897 / NBRC 102108 / NRRL B-24433 / ID139908) TaxID=479433 RepID=C7QF27_CATAD|nr:SDR family NAD(P)-dependent oxidoreductase [Catenulispora acidiphila]ACU74785.1 short-chain dehydrogenase/reductase SDR [Catenulispora acidiphila DSM 44928]
MTKTAVVTGASSGIGAATARRLAAEGYRVVLVARRKERLEALATEIGEAAEAVALDVTDAEAVKAFAAGLEACDVLVNNAGGAIGSDPVAAADPGDWRSMFETNVLGALNFTQALLPKLIASGAGTVVMLTSTAGHIAYEGGAGYSASKSAMHAMTATLRLEVFDQPVRVIEIAPGMVMTEEFSLKRFGGDADRAASVYAGVPGPLVAEDVADCIAWSVTRPPHVNVDLMVVRPRAQAAQHKVHRIAE